MLLVDVGTVYSEQCQKLLFDSCLVVAGLCFLGIVLFTELSEFESYCSSRLATFWVFHFGIIAAFLQQMLLVMAHTDMATSYSI